MEHEHSIGEYKAKMSTTRKFKSNRLLEIGYVHGAHIQFPRMAGERIHMVKASVTFWGDQVDGRLYPFRSYLVVASPWETPGSGVASVLLIAGNVPPSQMHYLAAQGGEEEAFKQAVEALKAISANSGLKCQIERT